MNIDDDGKHQCIFLHLTFVIFQVNSFTDFHFRLGGSLYRRIFVWFFELSEKSCDVFSSLVEMSSFIYFSVEIHALLIRKSTASSLNKQLLRTSSQTK